MDDLRAPHAPAVHPAPAHAEVPAPAAPPASPEPPPAPPEPVSGPTLERRATHRSTTASLASHLLSLTDGDDAATPAPVKASPPAPAPRAEAPSRPASSSPTADLQHVAGEDFVFQQFQSLVEDDDSDSPAVSPAVHTPGPASMAGTVEMVAQALLKTVTSVADDDDDDGVDDDDGDGDDDDDVAPLLAAPPPPPPPPPPTALPTTVAPKPALAVEEETAPVVAASDLPVRRPKDEVHAAPVPEPAVRKVPQAAARTWDPAATWPSARRLPPGVLSYRLRTYLAMAIAQHFHQALLDLASPKDIETDDRDERDPGEDRTTISSDIRLTGPVKAQVSSGFDPRRLHPKPALRPPDPAPPRPPPAVERAEIAPISFFSHVPSMRTCRQCGHTYEHSVDYCALCQREVHGLILNNTTQFRQDGYVLRVLQDRVELTATARDAMSLADLVTSSRRPMEFIQVRDMLRLGLRKSTGWGLVAA